VVGAGNIYATESLYLSGIHPMTAAGSIDKNRFEQLAIHIKQVLASAIESGGTTLRDFYASDGSPGYFAIKLKVYGRQGLACEQCSSIIESIKIAGRRSNYCPKCQPY
jgi:formamidopyrimidine-DNA glycosylase